MSAVIESGVPCACCGELRWPGRGPEAGERYTCQRCRGTCAWGHAWHAVERPAQAAARRAIKRQRRQQGDGPSGRRKTP
jgi:hypothetical protein